MIYSTPVNPHLVLPHSILVPDRLQALVAHVLEQLDVARAQVPAHHNSNVNLPPKLKIQNLPYAPEAARVHDRQQVQVLEVDAVPLEVGRHDEAERGGGVLRGGYGIIL